MIETEINLPEIPDSSNSVQKGDRDKSRIDLIDPCFIFQMGEVMAAGAAKYGDRNWEAGTDWGRYYAAAQRHLNAWWGPVMDDIDDETRQSHLIHAACCIMILYAYQRSAVGNDDRSRMDCQCR